MKNDKKLLSLELAKKMKELGFKQKSLWWWIVVRKGEVELMEYSQLTMLECNTLHAYNRICSAYTVAELGEMLPKGYVTSKNILLLNTWNCWKLYSSPQNIIEADTEANARAKMLIYLKEEGKI